MFLDKVAVHALRKMFRLMKIGNGGQLAARGMKGERETIDRVEFIGNQETESETENQKCLKNGLHRESFKV